MLERLDVEEGGSADGFICCFPWNQLLIIFSLDLFGIYNFLVFIINQRFISPVPAFLAPPPNPQDDHSNLDPRKSTSYLLTLTAWLQHFLRHTDASATRGANNKFTASPFEDLPVDDVLEFCLKRPNV
ncbi:hypothetical protein BC937DRAFT_89296 [Endogone sp. FLAS-F59071]|nr:hypothetical protein BC937DRAFT_89296 [Endogone sp. FLAS-F59071]|eukprot:RUS17969.1 hypothetical protein BC937DRAFT_89296 [Endogone sp. FLAS-F59071]